MQVRNDYDKEVFNGDIGLVLHVDKTRFRLFVDYDGRTVSYEKDELNDITLAYAVSVHKAQGSEYQAVIMPLLTQHYILLQRNLFYTALTRAKRLSIIIGSFKALYIAIKNDKPVQRNSLIRLMAAPARSRSAEGLGHAEERFSSERPRSPPSLVWPRRRGALIVKIRRPLRRNPSSSLPDSPPQSGDRLEKLSGAAGWMRVGRRPAVGWIHGSAVAPPGPSSRQRAT
jgi:hypothetical protein